VVAGSRTGNARGFRGRSLPLPDPRAWACAITRAWRGAGLLPALGALYLLAAGALLFPWPFGGHPAWAYNWEGYTAWRWMTVWERPGSSLARALAPTDGLMTDSGQGPLVGLPVAIGVWLGGFEIGAMRLPVTLLAAASVPVFWLLGRRVVGAGPATFAALLLVVSPVFLFYGRTATLVGVSLLPLLLTVLALAHAIDPSIRDGWRWRREGALAAALLLGIYAYAPVRLLWPLAIGALLVGGLLDAARRGTLWRAALLCALVVPAALMALEWTTAPAPDLAAAAAGYFHARGEQLVAMSDDPGLAGQYVRDDRAGTRSGWEAALALVEQNAADLTGLLLDRDTAPIPTDYWNERGRLWPWYLLPFVIAGTLVTLVKGLRGGQSAMVRLLPLLLALGLALPLLLTSRVHVGRLVPMLPFALLLAASGVWVCAGWLAMLPRRAWPGSAIAMGWIAPLLAAALLLPVAIGARGEMLTPLSPTREARAAALMARWTDAAVARGGAVLVEDPALGDEIEGVHAATYRLDLDRRYRLVDLQEPPAAITADARPPLFWHGALAALHAGAIDQPCQRLWFVAPEIGDKFLTAWRAAGCAGAPNSVSLP
jgi:4-amino-4-deoxy-L-arabinose transferase-like glycosyltransferase